MRKMTNCFSKFLVLGLVLFLTGVSCRQNLKSDLPVVALKIGQQEVQVEVANKNSTRMSGLMFRKEMGADNGMLFVFPNSAPRAFWMKNTYLPLSIAFLDEKGMILNILEMPPQTEDNFSSRGSAKFALEMNSRWFERKGIKPGTLVEDVLRVPKAED
jgi:uncharacterized protein